MPARKLTSREKILHALNRELLRPGGGRWLQPYQIATMANLRRGQTRAMLLVLARERLVFRRPSGRSWYGCEGGEYRARLESFGGE